MDGSIETTAMPDVRAAWQCSAWGFAAVERLSGSRSVLAVGSLHPDCSWAGAGIDAIASPGDARPSPAAPDKRRAAMRSVLQDEAMLEGHDVRRLLPRINAALGIAGLGHLDTLALLDRPADGMATTVWGAGRPLPLVVTPDGLSTSAERCVTLGPGWWVVLGQVDRDARGPLLAPADVRSALALLGRPPGGPTPQRTLLAVVTDG